VQKHRLRTRVRMHHTCILFFVFLTRDMSGICLGGYIIYYFILLFDCASMYDLMCGGSGACCTDTTLLFFLTWNAFLKHTTSSIISFTLFVVRLSTHICARKTYDA
jgi:hypothetical protein